MLPINAGANPLTINIETFHSISGNVIAHVYNNAEAFPTDPAKAVQTIVIPVADQKMTLTTESLPAGEYAVAVIHDLNENNKLDFNALWIPQEPYAFSNNAKGFMGPPKFKKAKFRIDNLPTEITVKLKH